MKKTLVKLITFVAGAYYLLEFVLPATIGGVKNPFSLCYDDVTNFIKVLGAMAILVGPINLIRGEAKTLIRRKPGWVESIVFLVVLVVSTVAAFMQSPEATAGFKQWMTIIYDAMFYGVGAAFAMSSMALLSFYLVSAAHRAFRLNSIESGLMMIAAFIVLLSLTPVSDVLGRGLPNGLRIGTMAQWILSTPNTAVQKAVLFGVCGGAFVAAMRQWLSMGKGQ
jgi:hypothetical protein